MASTQWPVVAGVDGSPVGLGAVHWAVDEAVRFDRPLRIIHALGAAGEDEPEADEYELTAKAAADARAWQPGLRVTTSIQSGGAAGILVEQSRRASLVVVGSPAPDEFEALPVEFLGTQLAAHAHCPVLVVHDARRWAGHAVVLPQHRPVLVGTDGSDRAQPAVELAFAEAAARHTGLIVLRSWQEPPHRGGRSGGSGGSDRIAEAVGRSLAAELEPWRTKYPAVPVEPRTVRGAPAPALLAAADHALMLVLGPRGGGGFDGLRLGSVTQQLLDRTPVPVLVARR
ncbi:universal stress protein [Dactylosporangium sp. CA-233914]|uniref:universal stress protein n=1 Tax=Dactylosporangium sp. CA-233914 TaxID=3239934 RepID=UPI003D8DF57D